MGDRAGSPPRRMGFGPSGGPKWRNRWPWSFRSVSFDGSDISEFLKNPHGREWLQFQAARGLAANTLDAYGRDLDAYLRFLASTGISFGSVVRNTLGAYIRSITVLAAPRVLKDGRETRTTLSNATLQQHLTVVRLFHDFLVEENICTRNPL